MLASDILLYSILFVYLDNQTIFNKSLIREAKMVDMFYDFLVVQFTMQEVSLLTQISWCVIAKALWLYTSAVYEK